MAIYAGETVRVLALGEDWDDTPLSAAQADAEVLITDVDGVLVESGPMVWVAEETRWRYDWDTTVPGAYTIEVQFSTAEGTSIDVRRVTLEAPRTIRPLLRPLLVRVG